MTLADPAGATIFSNTTENAPVISAGSSTTAGGSFTTLILNATTQTPRWKAYVGNVTGSFTLRDSSNDTLYDWGQTSTGGEVYSSRDNSIDWSSLQCANGGSITTEEGVLNMTGSEIDSISNTFNESVHKSFWVGVDQVANSTCPAIATYVNSVPQASGENADFQEILMRDTSNSLVYISIIDQDTIGYNNENFDFQMIVPESEFATTPHTYYFWLELS